MFQPLVRKSKKGMHLSLAVGVSHMESFNTKQHALGRCDDRGGKDG